MKTDTRALATAIEYMKDIYKDANISARRREVEALIKKWSWFFGEKIPVGNEIVEAEPIDPKLWGTMAILCQNEVEANPHRDWFEATQAVDIALPVKYTLPIIRNVFPQLIMNKICSVQPMPPSSGGTMKLFWLNVLREDDSNSNVTTANSLYTVYATETAIPKRLKMVITDQDVSATQEMLMAIWSSRVEEDLMGVHGLDVDREMVEQMSQEILRELEQRVVADIFGSASAGAVTWNWTKPDAYTSHTEYYQTLLHTFINAELYVRANRHRQCEYVVAGANVLGYLQKANYFTGIVRDNTSGPYKTAVQFEGRIGRWDVYSSDYLNDNTAFISYYPESMLHAGYIWAPYVPIAPMPKIYAEAKPYNDGTMPGALVASDNWTRRIRTRNARYYCQKNMFAKVTISA